MCAYIFIETAFYEKNLRVDTDSQSYFIPEII